MEKKLITWIIVVVALALIGYLVYSFMSKPEETPIISEAEAACTASGGTVVTGKCCTSASDFPNSCLIGACGCGPNDSKDTKTCDCGLDKCFDGTRCVVVEQPIETPTEPATE